MVTALVRNVARGLFRFSNFFLASGLGRTEEDVFSDFLEAFTSFFNRFLIVTRQFLFLFCKNTSLGALFRFIFL